MDYTALMYWLAGTPGLGFKRLTRLLETRSPRELWDMPEGRLRNIPLLPPTLSGALIRRRDGEKILEDIKAMEERGIWLLALDGPGYPQNLADIDDPPHLLYGMGRAPHPNYPKIAVIGARECTAYGMSVSRDITKGLAEYGFVIVSGMARGIDAAAHKTALDVYESEYGSDPPSGTIAVLGCGVDVCYPQSNYGLYKRIIKNGCLLSEYPPGTQPERYAFPRRNRIISGLSLGVIVVEAAARSGTSVTVGMALDQGREVFAAPGSVFSSSSVGTNNLIKYGATPITTYSDVLWALRRELGYKSPGLENNESALGNETHEADHNNITVTNIKLTGDEAALLSFMAAEPLDISSLAALSGMAAQDAMFLLTKLELAGLIMSVPGGRYMKK